jgi:spore germination protein
MHLSFFTLWEIGMEKTKISLHIGENVKKYEELFGGSADIRLQHMKLGAQGECACFLAYIEVSVQNTMLKESALGKMISFLGQASGETRNALLDENAMGISDITWYEYMEDAAQGMLTGDAVLFVDGYDKALKIADAGYPGMDVGESESEKVVRGSNEAFTDSVKTNTALIRKRVRSVRVRVEEMKMGVRSHTLINLVYMKDLVYPGLVEEIRRRMELFEIDGILDSGMPEQLAEEKWYSPFPQFQTTQRPDRASFAILEGRVVLLSDNSPVALILPADINSFLKTSDDYYNRFEAATFARLLRYAACFFAMTLPGLYLALTNFHTQILPTSLLLAFQEARLGMPFPAVLEVLLMELSFELLREAGVRLPGTMGNTIGIVGGLIIGQSAVEAHLVSPIVVIIVAFTALCSFAIPNEEFAYAFRILKFVFIFLCAWVGYFGFLIGVLAVLIHLSGLESFGIAYLSPFAGSNPNSRADEKDSIVRFPLRRLTLRPFFVNRRERTKLTIKNPRKPEEK